ncbi:histone-lysine N-methyltransferase ASHR1 isoform X3 [Cucumis melo var. makuwa]|uniref:Histone-lysine N-methyltransferase ASHR1 isoform X3 n=1 Tax=Cucumis melo var. makuwa TaxID=1194695 RepID=A0A5A7TC95_CUCMM|nr:histone-lysine N-methyltransferase ASHR1 isoform X3 [Cucumis melo var. makuwa]
MVQTQIEERLEVFDQEITELKKELSKILVIEASLSEIAKNFELMWLQSEKQKQMLLMMMESNAKERSIMSEQLTESATCDSTMAKGKENGATSSRVVETDQNIEDIRNEKKADNDENAGDQNKFKVEMPVYNGENPDSWLFRAERYFLIHKLTESEKC